MVLKNDFLTVNEQTCRFKTINGYLKFYFFNGWNQPLTERREKVGTCYSDLNYSKNDKSLLSNNYIF